MLQDSHQRSVSYLRLSITEACPMRCLYCRAGHESPSRDQKPLTPLEIGQLVGHLARRHGLRKVRLTGGEPTTRSDLLDIIRVLAEIDELRDLAMTTNGMTLARHASEYANAGLRRINISLDSLDRARFRDITGIDGLPTVLAGIDAALRAGLTPVRLNAVVLRNANDAELPILLRYAVSLGVEIRFIELMPMGPLADRWSELHVDEAQMRRVIEPICTHWQPLEQGHDAARRYRVVLDDGRSAVLGFITPMGCHFCAACNRIRVTSDGTLFPCLMDRPGPSLMASIRPRFDPDALDLALAQGLGTKQALHPARGSVMMVQLGG